jgi:hypothetical protein
MRAAITIKQETIMNEKMNPPQSEKPITIETSCGKLITMHAKDMSDRQLTGLWTQIPDSPDVDPSEISALRAELKHRGLWGVAKT